jgi:hypothetical protein
MFNLQKLLSRIDEHESKNLINKYYPPRPPLVRELPKCSECNKRTYLSECIHCKNNFCGNCCEEIFEDYDTKDGIDLYTKDNYCKKCYIKVGNKIIISDYRYTLNHLFKTIVPIKETGIFNFIIDYWGID